MQESWNHLQKEEEPALDRFPWFVFFSQIMQTCCPSGMILPQQTHLSSIRITSYQCAAPRRNDTPRRSWWKLLKAPEKDYSERSQLAIRNFIKGHFKHH
jgi:hypothetical protein